MRAVFQALARACVSGTAECCSSCRQSTDVLSTWRLLQAQVVSASSWRVICSRTAPSATCTLQVESSTPLSAWTAGLRQSYATSSASQRDPGRSDGGSQQGPPPSPLGLEAGSTHQNLKDFKDRPAHAPSKDDPYAIEKATDLPALVALIEQHAAAWSASKEATHLRTAFYALAEVGSKPRANRVLRQRALNRLVQAYLPLAPTLTDAHSCVAPLLASAKLDCWDVPLATAVLRRLGRNEDVGPVEKSMLARARPETHAHLWWSLSRAPSTITSLPIARNRLTYSARCLCNQPPEELSVRDCAKILQACARLRIQDDHLQQHLVQCMLRWSDVGCQALASTVFALGEMASRGVKVSEEDLTDIGKRVVELLGQGQGKKQGQGKGQEEQPAKGQTAKKPGEGPLVVGHQRFSTIELQTMLVGCAKLWFLPPGLLPPLAEAAGRAAEAMTGQQLVASLFALATIHRNRQDQTGSNNSHAAPSTYNTAVRKFTSKLVIKLQRRPDIFSSQELSKTLWALEVLRPTEDCDQLVQILASECLRRRFDGFTSPPETLTATVRVLADLGCRDPALYEAAVATALQDNFMASATHEDWASLWYGLALARHRPPEELLQAMVGELPDKRSDAAPKWALRSFRFEATAEAVARLLWALAALRVHHDGLEEVLVQRMHFLMRLTLPPPLSGRLLASSIWALAVLAPASELARDRLEGASEWIQIANKRWAEGGDKAPAFSEDSLRMLWQAHVELLQAGYEGESLAGGPSNRKSLYFAAQTAALKVKPSSPKMLWEVVAALQKLQTRLREGPRPADKRCAKGNGKDPAAGGGGDGGKVIKSVRPAHTTGGMCSPVDVAVELAAGKWVAIMVDGPSVFLVNGPHHRTKDGATQLRDRHLEWLLGEEGGVVIVPYWEWEALQGDAEQQEYLSNLLGLGLGQGKERRIESGSGMSAF